MVLWSLEQNEKATGSYFLHTQQQLAVNNHEEVIGRKWEVKRSNLGLSQYMRGNTIAWAA